MQTHVLAQGPAIEVASVEIAVQQGPDHGLRVKLTEPLSRVGTGEGNHLRLKDPTVSRMHCEIHLRSDGVVLTDPASTNGTVVDGVRVREAYLGNGSTIRVGASILRVQFGNDRFRLPLSARDSFGDLLGGSVEMRRVYAVLERVAPGDATVLIQGETGTGKEVVARSIHKMSRRAAAPFVAVDCGAIADNLIESELFGHTKGAFSGAVSDREGLFEEADGGTLFLDEIGELPLSLQPKLLRALEGREVRRVGSNQTRKIDVRVLAATNRPLTQSVNLGTFREDLYYRLAVVEVALPPLRARREDIPTLAAQFIRRFAGADTALPPELLTTLLTRSWPGNVRELRNFIEQRVSFGLTAEPQSLRGPALAAPPSLPPGLEALMPTHLPFAEARDAWVASFERAYVKAIVERAGGNMTKAAELAGMNRRYLYRLLEKLGMGALEQEK